MATRGVKKRKPREQLDPCVQSGSDLIHSTKQRNLVAALVIFLSSIVVFLPVLQNGFVNWDDEANLLQNRNFRGLGWAQLRWMFTTFYGGHYQPLAWVSFGMDYLLWGTEPFGYHLTNLLLHAANAVLFYFLAREILAAALDQSARANTLSMTLAAGFSALVFAIHPLRVESVAWATERRDVLSGTFLFSCVLCYLRGVKITQPRRRSPWMCASVLFFGLSILSKAIAVTLPIVLLVLDIYPLKRIRSNAGKWPTSEIGKLLVEKIPFLVLASIAALIAPTAQGGVMRSLEDYPLAPRISQALFGLTFYLWKTVIPLGLAPLYELPELIDPLDWRFLLSGFVVISLSIALFAGRRHWPGAVTAWICYIVILSPVLGLVQSGPQFVADRYSYLSCLSWALLAGAAIVLLRQSRFSNVTAMRVLIPVIAIAGLAILGSLTWKQVQVWRDSERLWRHVISTMEGSYFRPSIAHNNLGVVLASRGEYLEAIDHYQKALRINPAYAEAHLNAGIALYRRNETAEAIKHYREAVHFNPNYAEAHYNLGNALVKQSQPEEAIKAYRESLRLNPTNARVHYNLATTLADRGDLEGAIQGFRQALQIDPSYGMAHVNLATALAIRGEFAAAIDHVGQAVSSEPENANAHEVLARLLAAQGKKEEAAHHFREALRILKSRAQRPADR